MRLCGISTCFQVLSPCVRQVTHALLTRPPLECHMIWPKSHQRGIPVRLACVKHAASVHPEPGSNSLIIFLIRIQNKPGLFWYPKILFVSLYRSILFWKFSLGIFSGLHHCLFVKVLWSLTPGECFHSRLCQYVTDATDLYYHNHFISSTPFFNFSKFLFREAFQKIKAGEKKEISIS